MGLPVSLKEEEALNKGMEYTVTGGQSIPTRAATWSKLKKQNVLA